MSNVPTPSLAGRRVLLGVTGGIAAYKSADLVRRLKDAGADVQVVMTEASTRFVGPQTFQAVSGRPVRQSLWDEAGEAAMGHIELARWADTGLGAPATADFIARLTAGHGDDLLTTICLAAECDVIIAPAMNQAMWAKASTQQNTQLSTEGTEREEKIRKLRKHNQKTFILKVSAYFLPPESFVIIVTS